MFSETTAKNCWTSYFTKKYAELLRVGQKEFHKVQMQCTGTIRSDSGVSSYHQPHLGSIHSHLQHQQQQQHHPYYEPPYLVQGNVSNDVMMNDTVSQAWLSASGRSPHHHSGHPHHSHLNQRDLLSSKLVDYSSAMDRPAEAGLFDVDRMRSVRVKIT
ncbi:hypothetical protein DAPPUDRAFT_115786 [Daphnia pulex]|uniref:Uncharacterized protein n=1 Tax=Daphnia pulex TaxID=6669 RepID=E9HMI7_DAPPU|nr:hypothetical protein DAPPUDRAFT_115786 [Daphnia pulex]|eukprot:EFX67027.1 hypothetical protein DAPPUDRAFT_115786 [Daphnia pulex]